MTNPTDQGNPGGAIPVYIASIPASPLGYEQITGLSSVKGLTVPTGATMAVISVSTQAVRYRDDGTNPTGSVGMPLPAGTVGFVYSGPLAAIKFIEQTASAVLNVSYY